MSLEWESNREYSKGEMIIYNGELLVMEERKAMLKDQIAGDFEERMDEVARLKAGITHEFDGNLGHIWLFEQETSFYGANFGEMDDSLKRDFVRIYRRGLATETNDCDPICDCTKCGLQRMLPPEEYIKVETRLGPPSSAHVYVTLYYALDGTGAAKDVKYVDQILESQKSNPLLGWRSND